MHHTIYTIPTKHILYFILTTYFWVSYPWIHTRTGLTPFLLNKQNYSTLIITYISIKSYPLFYITPIIHTPTLYNIHIYIWSHSHIYTLQYITILDNRSGIYSSKMWLLLFDSNMPAHHPQKWLDSFIILFLLGHSSLYCLLLYLHVSSSNIIPIVQ